MKNKTAKAKLYNPSAIPTILKTARERALKPERRTKRWLADQLGITERRLTGIEDRTSQIHLEECIEWCEAVEDSEALEQIMHIYGIGLPPTDPRLLESVSDQLDNLKPEIEEAFQAAKQIEKLSQRCRPWKGFNEHDQRLAETTAKQIFDIKHAAECLLTAMENQWGLNKEYVEATWINGAISNDVVMRSVSDFEKLRRARTDQERMAQLGVIKG
ncbi:hypothetical protein J2S78_002103 [Salibacterium salarium]|uniref:hypothetical protein n=1 Tax=Salibacterium salarium TaxID=284579 RepID=UPI00278130C6|nr:hypothetical protein [Salibacterium salarium]MDQ0299683.1 hypothetical protein [Salibacterium salarium]